MPNTLTDTATVAWDDSTPEQVKANVPDSAITTAKINNDAVTYAKIQNISAASKLLGRGSAAGAGDVEEITLGTGLSMSGTTLSATGDVLGPASSTDNAIARYDLATGKLLQNSSVLISDANAITPASNDGGAIGTTALAWSDAFFASGAVLNFNAGNYTITHSAGSLSFSGAIGVGGNLSVTGNLSMVGTITAANTGLRVFDTNSTHSLGLVPGSDLSANRNLTLTTGDADRTLTLSGNLTVGGTSSINGTALVTTGAATLTGGFDATANNIGTVSSGTTTLSAASGNLQRYVNNGAHTLAPPSSGDCQITVQITNGAAAGAVTTSGFTRVTGDALSTTNGDDFLCSVTRINGFTHLHVLALQ